MFNLSTQCYGINNELPDFDLFYNIWASVENWECKIRDLFLEKQEKREKLRVESGKWGG